MKNNLSKDDSMKQYTISEVAERCHVTRQCVWQWIMMRKLKAQRLGSFWVVSGTDLERVKKQRLATLGDS